MDERLVRLCGGLLMVGIRGVDPGDAVLEEGLERCRLAGVRSVVLFDRDLASGGEPGSRNIMSPEQVRRLTDRVREVLGPGVRVAVDQEGGKVARLNETNGHERGISAKEFGRLAADEMRRAAAAEAGQLGAAGIDWNLAPCVDLEVVGVGSLIERSGRAFASSAERVIECAEVVIGEMQRRGVACAVKHFPGHGSAPGDTHERLLDITERHRVEELVPFRRLLGQPGAAEYAALMTAHLLHRGVDPDWPVSLSKKWTVVIREEIGFDGAIVTDALDMGAIAKRYEPLEAVLHAANAGADVLLLANNMPDRSAEVDPVEAAETLARAVAAGEIEGGRARVWASHERLDRLCRRTGG